MSIGPTKKFEWKPLRNPENDDFEKGVFTFSNPPPHLFIFSLSIAFTPNNIWGQFKKKRGVPFNIRDRCLTYQALSPRTYEKNDSFHDSPPNPKNNCRFLLLCVLVGYTHSYQNPSRLRTQSSPGYVVDHVCTTSERAPNMVKKNFNCFFTNP